MVDPSMSYLVQQQELLREIRDELRSGRQQSANMPGAGGAAVARPTSTFVQAQLQADRALAGEWGTFGWTNAYSPVFKSSLTSDIAASMGLQRSPNTLTQSEFQDLSADSLNRRAAGFFPGLVAGGFAGRSSSLASEIFAASGRFMRAGDTGVGPLGMGMGMHGAYGLATSIQLQAATDMRMSGRDYNAVASTGIQSGQFDFVRSTSEFLSKFKELKDATADLTRTMRMSVEEVSKSMGALRQFGVADVAEQSRMLTQMSASARVAGITPGEMTSTVRTAIDRGLSMGIGARASMGLATSNMMTVRGMSRDGILSTEVLAAGGGAQGIEAAMTGGMQQFLSSNAGFLALAGGGSGDHLDRMYAGLAKGGSVFGMMNQEAGRLDKLSKISGAGTRALYDSYVDQQLGLLGITDLDSDDAQGAMYTMSRNTMGNAGGLAYARSRGRRGRRVAYRAEHAAELDMLRSEDALTADAQYLNESAVGDMRKLGAVVGATTGGWYRSSVRALASGHGGYFGRGSRYDADGRAIRAGTLEDTVSDAGWEAAMLGNPAAAQQGTLRFADTGVGAWRGFATAGVVGTATLVGGFAGSFVSPVLGTMAGATLAGGAAAVFMSGRSGSNAEVANAEAYIAASMAVKTASGVRGKQHLGLLSGDDEFRALINDQDSLTATTSTRRADQLTRIAAKHGLGVQDVADAALAVGGAPTLMDTYHSGARLSAGQTSAVKDLLGAGWNDNVYAEDGSDFSFATSQAKAGLSEYITAVRSGSPQKVALARQGLASLGLGKEGFTALTANIKGNSGTDLEGLAAMLLGESKDQASRANDRQLQVTSRALARGLETAVGLDQLDPRHAKQVKESLGKMSGHELMLALAGSGGSDGESIRKAAAMTGGAIGGFASRNIASLSESDIITQFFGSNPAEYQRVKAAVGGSRTELNRVLANKELNITQLSKEERADSEQKRSEALTNASLILQKLWADIQKTKE